jgi:hypothetical protein
MSAHLDCPLCGAVVADGPDDISPWACPQCGARYEGGEGDVPGSVAVALAAFGAGGLDGAEVANAIFRLTPADSADRGVAITSDSRDDFYRWWLFIRAPGGDTVAVLSELT